MLDLKLSAEYFLGDSSHAFLILTVLALPSLLGSAADCFLIPRYYPVVCIAGGVGLLSLLPPDSFCLFREPG